MATKSYQNHELILTERKARQERAVIAAARRFVAKRVNAGVIEGGQLVHYLHPPRRSRDDESIGDRGIALSAEEAALHARMADLDETTAKLRALKRAEKTGLQAGRP